MTILVDTDLDILAACSGLQGQASHYAPLFPVFSGVLPAGVAGGQDSWRFLNLPAHRNQGDRHS